MLQLNVLRPVFAFVVKYDTFLTAIQTSIIMSEPESNFDQRTHQYNETRRSHLAADTSEHHSEV